MVLTNFFAEEDKTSSETEASVKKDIEIVDDENEYVDILWLERATPTTRPCLGPSQPSKEGQTEYVWKGVGGQTSPSDVPSANLTAL